MIKEEKDDILSVADMLKSAGLVNEAVTLIGMANSIDKNCSEVDTFRNINVEQILEKTVNEYNEIIKNLINHYDSIYDTKFEQLTASINNLSEMYKSSFINEHKVYDELLNLSKVNQFKDMFKDRLYRLKNSASSVIGKMKEARSSFFNTVKVVKDEVNTLGRSIKYAYKGTRERFLKDQSIIVSNYHYGLADDYSSVLKFINKFELKLDNLYGKIDKGLGNVKNAYSALQGKPYVIHNEKKKYNHRIVDSFIKVVAELHDEHFSRGLSSRFESTRHNLHSNDFFENAKNSLNTSKTKKVFDNVKSATASIFEDFKDAVSNEIYNFKSRQFENFINIETKDLDIVKDYLDNNNIEFEEYEPFVMPDGKEICILGLKNEDFFPVSVMYDDLKAQQEIDSLNEYKVIDCESEKLSNFMESKCIENGIDVSDKVDNKLYIFENDALNKNLPSIANLAVSEYVNEYSADKNISDKTSETLDFQVDFKDTLMLQAVSRELEKAGVDFKINDCSISVSSKDANEFKLAAMSVEEKMNNVVAVDKISENEQVHIKRKSK